MTTNNYRSEINGLRGIAVLSVILFHMGFSWVKGGFVGVDIFFVISGYLITRLIAHDLDHALFNFYDFWLRRARRILPALICVVFFSLITSWFLFLPDDFKSLGRSAFSLSLFASNVYFWLKTGYFTAPAETKPLLHTWTLAVEEQFYLVFPLMLCIITRYIPTLRTKIIFSFMLLSFALAILEIKNHQIAAFFLLPMRAWELLTGSMIAFYLLHKDKSNPQWFNESLSSLGLLAIGYAILFYNQNTLFPGWAALLPCLGTAAIIASNHNQLTSIGRLLSLRPLVMIGLISYSLYLWHWPFLVFAKYVFDTKLTEFQTVIILLASVFTAWISYIWIETPIRQKSILIHPKTFILTITVAICTIAGTGLLIDLNNGFPERLPPTILTAYQEAFHHSSTTCQTVRISKNVSVISNSDKSETPDFLLWGDSHAAMLLPMIEKMASQYHLTFWYYSCIPVLDVYQVNEHGSLTGSNCYISNHEMINIIEQKHIKNVLLASFWTQFTEGREIPMEGAGQRDPFYADETIKSTSPSQARVVFQKHFIETIKKLESANANVWIMKQVPAHRYWIANQLAKVLKFGGDTNKIGRPLSEYLKRQLFVNSVFDGLKTQKTHILDPTPLLCDNYFCHGIEQDHALYFDFNHLSDYGALKLKPLFKDVFLSISKEKQQDHINKKYSA